MIELLVIWLITIVASFGLKLVNELKLFKSIADFGYKVDIKKLFRSSIRLSGESIIETFSLLIPLYNIVIVAEKMLQYNNNKYKLLEKSGLINIIHQMTDEEKKRYLEKPTGFNAAHIGLEEKLLSEHFEKENQKNYNIELNENYLLGKDIDKKQELQCLKQELLIQNSCLAEDEIIDIKEYRLVKK